PPPPISAMEQDAAAEDDGTVVVGDAAVSESSGISVEHTRLGKPQAAASPAEAPVQSVAQQVQPYERIDVITPWSGRAEGDLDRMITTLEDIRASVRERAGWLQARPVFPLLDIRI